MQAVQFNLKWFSKTRLDYIFVHTKKIENIDIGTVPGGHLRKKSTPKKRNFKSCWIKMTVTFLIFKLESWNRCHFVENFPENKKVTQGETLGIKANQVELDFPYLMLFFTIFLAVLGLINVN